MQKGGDVYPPYVSFKGPRDGDDLKLSSIGMSVVYSYGDPCCCMGGSGCVG